MVDQKPQPRLIDPPQGWKYGFPKAAPDNFSEMSTEEVNKWLVDNEYPQSEVDYWMNSEMGGIPYRIIG